MNFRLVRILTTVLALGLSVNVAGAAAATQTHHTTTTHTVTTAHHTTSAHHAATTTHHTSTTHTASRPPHHGATGHHGTATTHHSTTTHTAGTPAKNSHKHNRNTVKAALRDCAANDPMKGHYTLRVLQTALHDVKAEPLQYTNCSTVLQQAIRALSLGSPKPPHSGGHSLNPKRGGVSRTSTTPKVSKHQTQINKKLHQLHAQGGKRPIKLPTGPTVTPGTVTSRNASFLSSLPTPLLIALAVLLAAVVGVSGRAIQNGVRARRNQ